MRLNRYALALSSLLLAGAGTAFGQVIPPTTGTPPPPAEPAPAPPVSSPASPAQAPAMAQGPAAPAKPAAYGPGMKVNLSPDGSKYLRFMIWTQVYARYTENNTGTLRAPSAPKASQIDFGIRRSRMVILAQLNPRFLVYTHFGINNQNAVSGGVAPTTDGKKPQLFIHEAVTEYRVNKYLNLGAGIHYYNGISRMTSASTTSIMAVDLPLTNFPTIELTDQFARWLGIYAKGRVGKFDYRVSMNDAFLTNQTSTPLSLGTTVGSSNTGTGIANYNPQNANHVYQGYFSYNFLEPEANLLPYTQGTYLGTKRVFSVGAGFLYNKDAMYSRSTGSTVTVTPAVSADPFGTVATTKHDMKLFGVDAFYDVPLDTTSRTAITLYGVYYNFNLGPNYVRFLGPENPGYGTSATRGNAVPQSGTGSSEYIQAGYLMPKNTLGPKARLQPYVAYMHSNYEGLRQTNGDTKGVNIYDAGVNLLLDGHNAKVTLNYRARPDFTNVNDVKYRPEITLQTQVFL
ncbi:hypothetical protein Q3A66_08220 [Hymenobacter sp. BT770]|uniref:hypothetical protein n=1 Tax=Hymenobacter sp. BT770 TaxID=2886942 RepID=UPI001D1062A9|nr:hypothetical protein [Hymenobacter sp. BT770]MCC3153033.1 hypothetical protein [Hymenobacter sp. BT770]MDO3415054.1 hypothetical protein [Hymenobacter sp. BT770]